MRKLIIAAVGCLAWMPAVRGQTAPARPPTTQPATEAAPSEDVLSGLLSAPRASARPLQPVKDELPVKPVSGGIAPGVAPIAMQREGSFIFDRVGRLTHSADGSRAEFTFESDGKTMKDPPVIILPNIKLMIMEDAVKSNNRDLRFRVTGMLTEYRGRNYLLLEKVLVPPDTTPNF